MLGVDAEYLRTALDEMRRRFGSIEGLLLRRLGIGESGQRALRGTFMEFPES